MLKGSGMSEIVESENLGAVIEPNGKSLKNGIDKIKKLKNDKKLKQRMSQLFENNYSWTIMEKRLNNLYNSLKDE